MTLPREAIRTDERLQGAESTAAEALMQHRWHWTLDEANPKRVTVIEYARQVARSQNVIYRDAHGFALYSAGAITVTEARERARMSADRATAADAVAEARGVSFKTANRERGSEVKRVRDAARERAEDKGTSVEEEAPKVAQAIARAEAAAEARGTERRERTGLRYVELEGKLTKAYRALQSALEVARDVPWEDDERELLSDTIANVRALLNLIDTAVAGGADIDWDAELAKLNNVA